MAIVPDNMWVTANFKETQLDLMRRGQPVAIRVDAYPDVKFVGHVDSIQHGAGQAFALLPPQNATGNYVKVVQRVPVRITFDIMNGPDPRNYAIGPGMFGGADGQGALSMAAAAAGDWDKQPVGGGGASIPGCWSRSSRSRPSWRCSTPRSRMSASNISRAGWRSPMTRRPGLLTPISSPTAIVIPLSGWLSDAIGRKRYFPVLDRAVHRLVVLCGIAPNLTVLVLARLFQGIGGRAASRRSNSRSLPTPSRRRSAARRSPPSRIVVVVGPVLGPTLGGYITDIRRGTGVFLINVPVGIAAFFLVQAFVDEPEAVQKDREKKLKGGLKIDVPGCCWSSWGSASRDRRRSRRARGLVLQPVDRRLDRDRGGVADRAGLARTDRQEPGHRLKLMKNLNFSMTLLVMMITGTILFGTTQLIPRCCSRCWVIPRSMRDWR